MIVRNDKREVSIALSQGEDNHIIAVLAHICDAGQNAFCG